MRIERAEASVASTHAVPGERGASTIAKRSNPLKPDDTSFRERDRGRVCNFGQFTFS
jgi:hypothetical protein